MTDRTGASGDPEPDQAEPEEAEGVELRDVSEDELREILEAHEAWVRSDGKEGRHANLSNADLQGADFSAANLRDANFYKADLQGADFSAANLKGAHLWEANLLGTNLQGTRLQGANLRGANLQGADLVGANLRRASLIGANLQAADLGGANLQGANLSHANFRGAALFRATLQGADLFGAKLQGAGLERANLQGADLNDAKLQGADLTRTNFEGREATKDGEALEAADLTGANFRDADLSDARLSGVTGLLADKLAGANLSNAKLPKDIARFDGLDHVTEISKHARNIFLAVIGGCVFSWLTIATTTDVALLTNSATTPLPIIQTKVPIAGFYWTAPVILLGLYIYLHLYLQRLWQGLAALPAVFPEGNSLDQRAYPWLLTSLVNAHVPRLKEKRPPFSRLQVFLSIIAAWVLVPATLGLFWLRYLSRHDWPWTGEQVGILALAATLGIAFYRRARATLRGDEPPDFAWKTAWKSTAIRLYAPLALFFAAAGYGISDGAIKGIPYNRTPPEDSAFHRVFVPKVFNFFGASSFLDLVEQEISIKPPAWTGLEEGKELEAQIAFVKKARLTRRDLRYADASSVFLVRADLSLANLQRAILQGANLQGAILSGANLQGATLTDANLQGAILSGANLQGAILSGANLQGANLHRANFEGAILSGLTLYGIKLKGRAKGLTQEQLNGACGDHYTGLPSPDLTIRLCSGLKLGGVDLRKFKGLTQGQLDRSCGDAKTKLPPGLEIKPCEGESGAKN